MRQVEWLVKEKNEVLIQNLSKQLNISKPLCNLLINRKISTYDQAYNFFRPQLKDLHDPFLMKDMKKAVDRIIEAIKKQEKILVFGDYDVDGTTSVAIIYQFLKSIYTKEKLDYYIPHRYREGYGVSKQGIDFAKENNFTLIISLDCGIKSVELVDYAKGLNIDFIICDHHLPGDKLPNAIAILDAKQKDCKYPFKELCGCGVGFKLICGICKTLNIDEKNAYEYLDLVAVAIAADIVSMTGENRILAFYGLKKINENPQLGIKILMKKANLVAPVNISNVVFVIAPRINAAGRMDDAKKAVTLFVSEEIEDAKNMANELHQDNDVRREADKQITEEALDQIKNTDQNKFTTVVYKEDWHKGVVGIVASRIIEHIYKPTIVFTLSNGLITGSARSVVGFDLYEAIYECKDLLTAFGGHFAAAGLSLLPENLNLFKEKFEAAVAQKIKPENLKRVIDIDAEILFENINAGAFKILEQMEPYGPDNMRPIFIAKKVKNEGSMIVKEEHIRFQLSQEGKKLSGIGFRLGHKFHELSEYIDVVFTIDENTWNNVTNLQMKVIDFRGVD